MFDELNFKNHDHVCRAVVGGLMILSGLAKFLLHSGEWTKIDGLVVVGVIVGGCLILWTKRIIAGLKVVLRVKNGT